MGSLTWFKRTIEQFTEQLLSRYNAALQGKYRKIPKRPKEFNDPVARTIKLHPLELVVLDSPILQRLRRIRHLGVVHLVYPSAVHTRFEHSLGVVHQVQFLINAVNTPEPYIKNEYTRLLRLAALCHDVGHGTMSHVSENATENFPEIEKLRLAFADKTGREDIALHEMAAYYMLGSKAFHKMLELGRSATRDEELPIDFFPLLQRVGIKDYICDDIPLLQELISGPFDADKLDYLVRDSIMCGVPVITDVNRLIQKVRGVRVKVEDLPPRVGRGVRGDLTSYVMTGIALSGSRTLDELLVARHFMFDKIYRHQKVRSAEAMVAGIFVQLGSLLREHPSMCGYKVTDEELLNLDANAVASIVGRRLTKKERIRCDIAAFLVERLRERNLLVRSFAFSRNMPRDPYREDPTQAAGLVELANVAEDPERRGALVNVISDEAETILHLIGERTLMSRLPGNKLEPYIWLSPPQSPRKYGDIALAHLIAENGSVLPYREESAEARGWIDAYLINADIGYIFAPFEIAPYVYLAAEKVIRERYGVRIPSSMVSSAKQDEKTLEGIKNKLGSKGYYRSAPYDIRPSVAILQSVRAEQIASACAARLAGYEGIAETEEKRIRCDFDKKRVLDWARQFDSEVLIDAALSVIAKIELIGRAYFAQGLSQFVAGNGAFRGGFVCPLGSPKDSSSIVTYYAEDVVHNQQMECASLLTALGSDSRPVLFVDDFLGSGKQATTIVQHWMGVSPSYHLGERRETIREELRVAFKKRKIGFFFGVASEDGVMLFKKHLKDLDLDANVGWHRSTSELPCAFGSGILARGNQENRFRRRCEEIGFQLLVERGTRHDRDWAKDKVLGYGNRAYLVVFPYNTPAQTLTCLWRKGTVDGVPWIPLFPRRKKR